MALLTFRTHLAAMNVSMAIGALVTHVVENRSGVALGARHTLMHTAQWESCVPMIELRNVADRLPSRKGVAVLAGDI